MHPTSGGSGTVCGRPSVHGFLMGVPESDSGAGPAFQVGGGDRLSGSARCPMRSNLELGPFPSAVPCARIHARLVVAEWGLPKLADVVELVVSELVTNGLQASVHLKESRFGGRWTPGTPPVRLWLCSDYRQVLMQVWDGNHELPVRQNAGPEAEGGRGLLLVESLSVEWGSYQPPECSGKVVWAVVA
jgi:hypothetical protein